MNSVNLIGRIVAEPELKTTTNNISILRFNIVVNRNFITGANEQTVDYIPLVAWRGTAEWIARNFHKGDLIGITGKLASGSYENKDGKKQNYLEVTVVKADFCGFRKSVVSSPEEPSTEGVPTTEDDPGLNREAPTEVLEQQEMPF